MLQQQVLLVERTQLFLALLPFLHLSFRVHRHLDLDVLLVVLCYHVHLVKLLVVHELGIAVHSLRLALSHLAIYFI